MNVNYNKFYQNKCLIARLIGFELKMGQNKCDLCEYIGRGDNLKRHVYLVHKNPQKKTQNDPKYACGCGKKFTAASSLKRHKEGCCGKTVDSSIEDSVDEPFTLDEIVKVEYLVTLYDGSIRKVPASVESLLSNSNIQMTAGGLSEIFVTNISMNIYLEASQ